MVRLPRRIGPLEEREFRLLYAGQAVSLLGDALVPVALAFAVLDLTGSAADLGFVFAARSSRSSCSCSPAASGPTGCPRQLVMLGSDVVRGLARRPSPSCCSPGARELWQLIVLAAVYGTAEAFFRPAATGLIPRRSRRRAAAAGERAARDDDERRARPRAGARRSARRGRGAGVALAFDAGTFAVSAAFLLQLRPAAVERRRSAGASSHELAAGWGEFRSRTWLWAIVLSASILLFGVVAPFQVLGPLVSKEPLGGAAAWALILTAFALGAVVGGAIALRWRPARPLLVARLLGRS